MTITERYLKHLNEGFWDSREKKDGIKLYNDVVKDVHSEFNRYSAMKEKEMNDRIERAAYNRKTSENEFQGLKLKYIFEFHIANIKKTIELTHKYKKNCLGNKICLAKADEAIEENKKVLEALERQLIEIDNHLKKFHN